MNLSSADKSRHDKLVVLVDKMLGLTPKLRAATRTRKRPCCKTPSPPPTSK